MCLIIFEKKSKNTGSTPFEPEPGSGSFVEILGHFLCVWNSVANFSVFSSKIIRHIMYMINTYIIKIQSRNLTHDHRLSAVQKVFFQMILKNKVKNDPSSGSNFLSLNRDRDRLEKYWAITT